VIVNKIDAENVDCGPLGRSSRPTARCLPLNLPAAQATKVSIGFAPAAADFSSVEEAHRKLAEQVVEVDEAWTSTSTRARSP
jgi:elongation factor G